MDRLRSEALAGMAETAGTLGPLVLELHDGTVKEIVVEPPRNLWHAILFYTVGESTRRVLSSDGVDYTPYMLQNRVFESFHDDLKTIWVPYMDGEVSWNEAVASVTAG